jgi:hypothetical protein
METTNMTHLSDNERIPATADATMMHILTHGFSSLHGNRRGLRSTKRRDEDTRLAGEIRSLITLKSTMGRATTIDSDALAASLDEGSWVRTAKLSKHRITRQVEVVRVRSKDGVRHVVGREFCSVQYKRPRQN